jgi:hypothetical protein
MSQSVIEKNLLIPLPTLNMAGQGDFGQSISGQVVMSGVFSGRCSEKYMLIDNGPEQRLVDRGADVKVGRAIKGRQRRVAVFPRCRGAGRAAR